MHKGLVLVKLKFWSILWFSLVWEHSNYFIINVRFGYCSPIFNLHKKVRKPYYLKNYTQKLGRLFSILSKRCKYAPICPTPNSTYFTTNVTTKMQRHIYAYSRLLLILSALYARIHEGYNKSSHSSSRILGNIKIR